MRHPERRQQGVVLLLLLLTVFMMGSTLFLGAMNNRQSTSLQQERELLRQMQLAKQALLAYAANNDSLFTAGPGLLPCPDIDNTSVPEPDCDPASEYMGRLPRYVVLPSGEPHRFYFNETYAGLDQQFWYAVSPAYIHSDNPASESTKGNTSIYPQLTLDGTGDIVALLIAPGEALDGQDRPAGPVDYEQYLEGGNGSGFNFFSNDPDDDEDPDIFNDKVLAITRSEVMSMATAAVAKAIKTRLDAYHTSCGYYPLESWYYDYCTFSWNRFPKVMESASVPDWVRASSATLTGEQNWVNSSSSVTQYTQVSNDEATVTFSSCAITYTLHFSNGISKDPSTNAC